MIKFHIRGVLGFWGYLEKVKKFDNKILGSNIAQISAYKLKKEREEQLSRRSTSRGKFDKYGNYSTGN